MAKKGKQKMTTNDEASIVNETLETESVKKVAFCTVEGDGGTVLSFKFGNGHVLAVDLNELSEDIKSQLCVHGLTQKIRDSFAGCKGDFAVAIGLAEKVADQLLTGQWTASRASAGEAAPKITELVEALANLKSLDLAVVQAAVEKATPEKQKEWRKNAAVAAEIARLRAVRAAERAAKAKDEGIALDL